MRSGIGNYCLIVILLLTAAGCGEKHISVKYTFDSVHDRIWIAEDFWTVPLEDWRIHDGRIEFTGKGQQSTCTVLPYTMDKNEKSFLIRMDMGLIEKSINNGSAGLIIGSEAIEEEGIKSRHLFWKRNKCGSQYRRICIYRSEFKETSCGFQFRKICN